MDLYYFSNRRPRDHGRAEELPYATPGVRDREDIADRLTLLYKETGRLREAKEFAGEAKRAGPAYGSGVGVRRTVELVEGGDRAVVRDTATATFEGEGMPLQRLEEIVAAWTLRGL